MSAASWKLLRLRLNAALTHLGVNPDEVTLEYRTNAGDMSESPDSWTATLVVPPTPTRMALLMKLGLPGGGPTASTTGASGEDAFCNLVMSVVRAAESTGWHCSV